MQDAISLAAPLRLRLRKTFQGARAHAPTRAEAGVALLSALLLIFSFPDFNLWPLAWVGLVPLFLVVARRPRARQAFLLGWMTGTLFFYGSCYWLTYSMIRYGHIPAVISYPLLVPATLIVGLFPGACCALLARVVARWGRRALLVAPILWAALEWARLASTGQLWNAIGYSQAYHPALIQAARWGGVYLVGFLIVTVNAAVAYALLLRTKGALITAAFIIASAVAVLFAAHTESLKEISAKPVENLAVVIALQPDVPMDPPASVAAEEALVQRHLSLSADAIEAWNRVQGHDANLPHVVIWPESPMNFTYAKDSEFRELLANFTRQNHTSVLFNSLEPAPLNGSYNSAVMVNEEGRLIAQYDKIRLLPFGEYVPLPRWLPGANLVPTMVGDFTPGAQYTLMPFGEARAGIFICFESAFPEIARQFTAAGADVLVNISNDGYLGPTPVRRQHLANAVFRAVENNRPVVRVTNTGITAYINPQGEVLDATESFQTAVRTWTISRNQASQTFYTKHGDLFVILCAIVSLFVMVAAFTGRNRTRERLAR